MGKVSLGNGAVSAGPMATWRETALVMPCQEQYLLGIVTRPPEHTARGLILIAGGEQYRVGPHRQHVQLARRLAAAGVASLRFDSRGIGDSVGPCPGFMSLGPEIDAAIAAFRAAIPELRQLYLWGLCDGAAAIILHLPAVEAAVAGVILVNPWARSEAGLAAAQLKTYLPRRALSREFWGKLVSGKIDPLKKLQETWKLAAASRPTSTGQDLPARLRSILSTLAVPQLIILAPNDMTAIEFRSAVLEPLGGTSRDREILDIADADHTFSDPAIWQQVQNAVIDWLVRREVIRCDGA